MAEVLDVDEARRRSSDERTSRRTDGHFTRTSTARDRRVDQSDAAHLSELARHQRAAAAAKTTTNAHSYNHTTVYDRSLASYLFQHRPAISAITAINRTTPRTVRHKKIPVFPVAVWRKSSDGGGGCSFIFIFTGRGSDGSIVFPHRRQFQFRPLTR